MKKIFLLLITSLLAINIAHAQNDWITYNADSKLTIKLPTQPQKIDDYSVKSTDKNSLIYVVGVVDLLKTDGTDSATLVSKATTPEYVKIMRDKLVESMPGFELGDIKTGTWKGYTCYHIDGVHTATKANIYFFMFIIGSKLYSLFTYVPVDTSSQGKDDFFASAVVN